MLKVFNKFLKEELQLKEDTKVVLAVSGGADSMAMLDLFSKSKICSCIAHCNFHLRESESDEDENFVQNLANKYKIQFYKMDFNTKACSRQKGISIEMAARDLRYSWFEELRQKLNYDYIATAHHQDDIIETFFINIIRGTGIRGLTGIKPVVGKIIRPMLFSNRTSIINYCKSENIDYREDSSNSDVTIIRNKLRHLIIPLIKQVNQNAGENIIRSIENLQDAEKLFNVEIERAKNELLTRQKECIKLNIEKLKNFKPVKAYLFEILRPFGFNSMQIKDIESFLDSTPGKIINSKTHQIIKDRDELIISSNEVHSSFRRNISDSEEFIELPMNRKLKIEKIKRSESFKIPKEYNFAAVDFDKIKFPLLIREWEQGDSFFPLGMTQLKKLSNYFIDEKFSLIEKHKSLLLISDNQIVWLIGNRIDNRFKISDKTRTILLMRID